jgi:hypothetical protein
MYNEYTLTKKRYIMFSTRNIIIAAVVAVIAIVGFFLLKPSKKVEVAPAKPAVTQPVAPVKK